MAPAAQPGLRRIGGPPRKIPPATPARKAATGSTASPSTSAGSQSTPAKEIPAEGPRSNRKKVSLRANPSLISQLEFEEEEDDDWDEVALPPGREPISRDFASSPAGGMSSRAASRALTVTDDEAATDRTATATEGEDEEDKDHNDLMAAYGYDFNAEEKDQNAARTDRGDIEISLGARDGLTEEQRKAQDELANRKKPLTARDRALRLEAHKLHIICLLANASIRNKWCCDDLLKSRLLSLTPHALHAAFHIPPSRYPDAMHRARLFQTALQDLATWWANDYFEVSDTSVGIQTRGWDEVMEIVERLPRLVQNAGLQIVVDGEEKNLDTALKEGRMRAVENLDQEVVEEFQAALGPGGERIRTVNSFMKKVLQARGGRDTSAQLFVALCRSLGLGARLVVSLQPIQWKADKQPTPKSSSSRKPAAQEEGSSAAKQTKGSARGKGKQTRRKGKMPEKTASEEEEEDEMEEVQVTGSSAQALGSSTLDQAARNINAIDPIVISDTESHATNASSKSKKLNVGKGGEMNPLKKERADYYKLGKSKPTGHKLGGPPKSKRRKEEDLTRYPPVFWAEVYSRSEQKWIPVDPVKGVIKRKKDFEPSSETGPIRMLYVVAFEEDGYAREVTVRYARNFAAKTMKLRVPVKKDQEDWWSRVMRMLERPYRLHRDDIEDAELEMSQVSEGMPMVMAGFKDHPLYVLERHLKREEVIMPKREVGRFKGEPVYRRSNVVSCKTPENWMRIGRIVKEGQEPLKWVKQRAVTLDRRRAQELANQEGKDPIQQGLYAEWQTELFRPPPIKDGKIPKNAFGNLDLYTPTMLPEGAVHLPYKGIAKVAKQLGVDYAETCTGFEFKKQRAIPVLTGIAVATEFEALVLENYWKSAAAAEERALNKKQQRALERWFKLINGIKIRKRVQAQYGESSSGMAQMPRTTSQPKRVEQTKRPESDDRDSPMVDTTPAATLDGQAAAKNPSMPTRPITIKLNVSSTEKDDLPLLVDDQPQRNSLVDEDLMDEVPVQKAVTPEPDRPTEVEPPIGRRTTRRAAAVQAKKKLKVDEDAEDADDEYRSASRPAVRKSGRITRSSGR